MIPLSVTARINVMTSYASAGKISTSKPRSPSAAGGRAFLVERGLERDGNAALNALVGDYVEQARRLDAIPMGVNALGPYLDALRS
jgi:hypothetical protein